MLLFLVFYTTFPTSVATTSSANAEKPARCDVRYIHVFVSVDSHGFITSFVITDNDVLSSGGRKSISSWFAAVGRRIICGGSINVSALGNPQGRTALSCC